MSYFEIYQKNPGLLFLIIIISLVITLLVYGAFPIIFAKTRKKPISIKKYKRLCYGINAICLVFFIIINGASNGAPYLLWTWVFYKLGIKFLTERGVLTDALEKIHQPPTLTNKITFCRKCGTKLEENIKFCRKCGTEIKEEQL